MLTSRMPKTRRAHRATTRKLEHMEAGRGSVVSPTARPSSGGGGIPDQECIVQAAPESERTRRQRETNQ